MTANSEFRNYLGLLLHWAWLLILATGLAGATAYFVSDAQERIYQASTTISIQEAVGTNIVAELNSMTLSERRVQQYVELLTARPLLDDVGKELNLSSDISSNNLEVTPIGETHLIRIRVRDTDPQRAASIANMLVRVFAARRQQVQSERYAASKQSLEAQLANLDNLIQETTETLSTSEGATTGEQGSGNGTTQSNLESVLAGYRQSYADLLQSYEQVRLAEAQSVTQLVQEEIAVAPAIPVEPRILTNSILGAVTGLILALGLIFIREAMDDTVKDVDLLAKQINLPILGMIGRSRRSAKRSVSVATDLRSPLAEAYRSLRTNIQFAHVDRPLRTLMITSPSPEDGKSTTAINLAAMIAQSGRRVVLVDADLRRPTLHQYFDKSTRVGLTDVFVQPMGLLTEAIQTTTVDNLTILPAGVPAPNPAELLSSKKMLEILHEAQQQADVVVIDTPPVTVVTDAVVLASHVDGVLLVVRAGQTHQRAAIVAHEQLSRVNAHILGIVVNDIPVGQGGYSYYYGDSLKYYAAQDQHNVQSSQWWHPASRRAPRQPANSREQTQ